MRYARWPRRWVHLALVPCLPLLASGCKGAPQATKAAPMQQGEASGAQEQYAEAVIACRNAIKLDSKDAQPYDKRALVCLTQGEA